MNKKATVTVNTTSKQSPFVFTCQKCGSHKATEGMQVLPDGEKTSQERWGAVASGTVDEATGDFSVPASALFNVGPSFLACYYCNGDDVSGRLYLDGVWDQWTPPPTDRQKFAR